MDKDELWQKTLALMLENVGDDDLKASFLKRLSPLGVFGDQFILLAQSDQVESWVKTNYLAELNERAAVAAGHPLNVSVVAPQVPAAEQGAQQSATPQPAAAQAQMGAPAPYPQPQAQTAPAPAQMPTQAPAEPTAQQPDWMNTYVSPAEAQKAAHAQAAQQPEWMNAYLPDSDRPQTEAAHPAAEEVVRRGSSYEARAGNGEVALFEKCTFDTFVVGKSNEFARGAALAVAEKPGTVYNPLFIYGGSGLGKTHLLVSIANYVLQNWPAMATCYVSANQFLNDYVEAVQRGNWGGFNKKYHQVDVLLVDDVQYLEGKDETINQLFNIFNEMTNQNKQIVLAADRAPKDIDMDERYRSRFMSGLLADVKPPDYETRLAIMRNYLASVYQQTLFNGTVPDDVLAWLASEATSNIREMEGAINRLVSNMKLLHRSTISVDDAQQLLQDFFPNLTNKQIDIATIQSEVEHYFGITHDQMVGKTRAKGVTTPRHIAIYLSRYLTEESLESIGKKFGGRDHTTVMHSVNKIEREREENHKLFEQIDALEIRIKERS